MINDLLSYKDRCLRKWPGKLLLGSAGNRLFADYLDKKPGFCGRIDFIHKLNIPSLFQISCNAVKDFDTAESVWYPSMLVMEYRGSRAALSETKFITRDDIAVSIQRWTNLSDSPFELALEVPGPRGEKSGKCLTFTTPENSHGFSVGVAVANNTELDAKSLMVQPGATVELTVAAAVGNMRVETMEALAERAAAFLYGESDRKARHNKEYQSFFDLAPTFQCSDAVLTSTWNYRWFLMKHNLARPDFGDLQGAVMYEGRAHKMEKKPYAPEGWEFSKLINLSTPLHLTDMRWHQDKSAPREMIRNMLRNVDENGIFCSAFVDRRLHSYSNYAVWAIWLLWLTDGDSGFIRDILPDLKTYVKNEEKTYGRDDLLQVETNHTRTGKEYQPSYWYFDDYPANPKTGYTHLKRVDRSIYHYKNVRGLALLCDAVGDDGGSEYHETADKIASSILGKMWDDDTGFFYDLHHETDQKAFVKNIVGIYPHWAGITHDGHLRGLELLFDGEHFNTSCPFPSVSRECPAYRPYGSWQGNFMKGRDGCCWCGPSWPYTTGIAIDAIGIQSKLHGHCYDGQFGHYLREYAWQHFRDRNISKPYLVEHYNAESGEPLSDEADYNHSFFIDLIMTHVAGITLTPDNVSFDPLDIGLDYFKLENVPVRGDLYTISFKRSGCMDSEAVSIPEGYHVQVNGKTVL